MKTQLRSINDHGLVYTSLVFVCPGCVAGGPEGYDGLHMLPVSFDVNFHDGELIVPVDMKSIKKPFWDWDGNLEAPTLSPSILSDGYCRCHSFLKAGFFQFLDDSTHPLAGQNVPIPDLPEWVVKMDYG